MDRNRIGIVTIALKKSSNYGNILQTYALQAFLRKAGFEPVTIYYESDYVRKKNSMQSQSRILKLFSQSMGQSLEDISRIIKRTVLHNRLLRMHQRRQEAFVSFREDNISYTKRVYNSTSDFSELTEQCSCFITGSDQIWNPYYEGGDSFAYLTFAEKGKRIAYAPSIGMNEIPEEMREKLQEWITQIDYLSVREQSSKELLLREFALDSKVVCDPVFLLGRDFWHDFHGVTGCGEEYFAVYILGKKTKQTKQLLRSLEKTYGIPSRDIYTGDDPASEFASPKDCLAILDNAKFVVTDSFHGLAFSVIFEKSFVVLPRYSQTELDDRLQTLLELLRIPDDLQQLNAGKFGIISPDYSNTDLPLFIRNSSEYLLSSVRQCIQ